MKKFWNEKEAKRLFHELGFYVILIEKPLIKRLKNIDLLHELPFYDKLSIVKTSQAFKKMLEIIKLE